MKAKDRLKEIEESEMYGTEDLEWLINRVKVLTKVLEYYGFRHLEDAEILYLERQQLEFVGVLGAIRDGKS